MLDVLVVLVVRLARLLAVVVADVAEDERAGGDHLAELGRGVGIGQIGGRELQLAQHLVHVLAIDDREALGVDQRLFEGVGDPAIGVAGHAADGHRVVRRHVDLGGLHHRDADRDSSTGGANERSESEKVLHG